MNKCDKNRADERGTRLIHQPQTWKLSCISNSAWLTASGKLPPDKFPPIKLPLENPPGKFPPRIFPPTFLNVLFFHHCHRYPWYYLKDWLFRDSRFSDLLQCIKKFCSLPAVYLFKEVKNLLRVRLLYNIKVMGDTVRHNEKFSNFFSSKALCL